MEPKKDKSIGAVWLKQSAYGAYLSISIEIDGVKHNYTAFSNQYKERDNQPDYRIMPPKRPQDGMTVTSKYEDQIAIAKAYQTIVEQKPAISEEDVPF